MIKSLVLFTTFIISANAYATQCSFNVADKVYRLANSPIPYEVTGCNRSQIEILEEILSSAKGNLNLQYSREFRDNEIVINNKQSVVVNLDEVIKTQFSIPNDWKVSIKTKKTPKSITTDAMSSIELTCNNCQKLGERKVKLTYNETIKWLDIVVQKPVVAVVAKNEINLSYNSIEADNVEKKTIYTTDDKAVFKNIDEVSFYKSNKVISPGEVVKKRDLSPINLVTFGIPVKVILDNNGIKLTGTATPLSTGKLKDFIKVKNTKTNKVFTAKIIGLNEVKVEL